MAPQWIYQNLKVKIEKCSVSLPFEKLLKIMDLQKKERSKRSFLIFFIRNISI